jgi:hypothetical protein
MTNHEMGIEESLAAMTYYYYLRCNRPNMNVRMCLNEVATKFGVGIRTLERKLQISLPLYTAMPW